jgi:hypothetical protein
MKVVKDTIYSSYWDSEKYATTKPLRLRSSSLEAEALAASVKHFGTACRWTAGWDLPKFARHCAGVPTVGRHITSRPSGRGTHKASMIFGGARAARLSRYVSALSRDRAKIGC